MKSYDLIYAKEILISDLADNITSDVDISITYRSPAWRHMIDMAFQIIGRWALCSTAYLDYHERKYQSSALVDICERSPPVTSGFPSQSTSNVESNSVSCFITWLKHQYKSSQDGISSFIDNTKDYIWGSSVIITLKVSSRVICQFIESES